MRHLKQILRYAEVGLETPNTAVNSLQNSMSNVFKKVTWNQSEDEVSD